MHNHAKGQVYDDPKVDLSWKTLDTVFADISNPSPVIRVHAPRESGTPGAGVQKKKSKASKRQRHRKKRSDTASSTQQGQSHTTSGGTPANDDLHLHGTLFLTMILNSHLDEAYVLRKASAELPRISAYVKGCQAVSSSTELGIIMFHRSMCLHTAKIYLSECLLKQEALLHKHRGHNSRFFTSVTDPVTNVTTIVQKPLPSYQLRPQLPPKPSTAKTGGKAGVIPSDTDKPYMHIVAIEISTEGLNRLSEVFENLRQNESFQKYFGHKVSFIDIGSRRPRTEEVAKSRDWLRNLYCHRGFNYMYDSNVIPHLADPTVRIKVVMNDSSKNPPYRTTSLLRELTNHVVHYFSLETDNYDDRHPYLITQLAAISDPRNSQYGGTTVIFLGASAMRQRTISNLVQFPLEWVFGFLTIEKHFHPNMVKSLMRRSFPTQHHEIETACEDVNYDPESMTVSTPNSARQDANAAANENEQLHLPLEDLQLMMSSKAEVDQSLQRASMFDNRGLNPDASVVDERDADPDHVSNASGLTRDPSVARSEQTDTFNASRMMKYQAAKLDNALNKAKISEQEAEIKKLKEALAKMSAQSAQKDGEESEVASDLTEANESRTPTNDGNVDVEPTENDSIVDLCDEETSSSGSSSDESSSSSPDSSSSSGSSSSDVPDRSTSRTSQVNSNFDVDEYEQAAAMRHDDSDSSDSASDEEEASW